MLILKLLLLALAGILLSGLWFALTMLVGSLAAKTGSALLSRLRPALAAAIPTIVILCFAHSVCLNFSSVTDYKSWLVIAAAVVLTSFIVSPISVPPPQRGKELLLYGLDGALMEIPQRLMMQTFLLLVSDALGVGGCWPVLLTAVVWCISICLQCIINKAQFSTYTALELASSFLFSLSVGFVFARTGFIGFTMLAHFCERLLSTILREKLASRKKQRMANR